MNDHWLISYYQKICMFFIDCQTCEWDIFYVFGLGIVNSNNPNLNYSKVLVWSNSVANRLILLKQASVYRQFIVTTGAARFIWIYIPRMTYNDLQNCGQPRTTFWPLKIYLLNYQAPQDEVTSLVSQRTSCSSEVQQRPIWKLSKNEVNFLIKIILFIFSARYLVVSKKNHICLLW